MSNNSTSKSGSKKGNANNNASSKGWFEGTMEVISGMEVISALAPRPSTPVNNPPSQQKKKRPGQNTNANARGSMSAPSSPARSTSAFFPLISRLPSQDSMDRSIHNESSSHGKSASQIIRELKQSNALLSAKTATMEADFMNQINLQNRKAEERQRRLEETIKKSEKLIAALEARTKSAEQSLKERDDQLAKLREEGAFQRHTISDLKNQLHQMELEQEESAYGKRDDSDDWKAEKMRMEQEIEDLRAQVLDSQVLQQEVDRLNHKLEHLKMSSHAMLAGTDDDGSVSSQLGSSQRSSVSNRSFMKQGLPQTREILKKTKHRLSVTEAALDILKQERARMMHDHQLEVEDLQHHVESIERAHHEREQAMQQRIQHLEQQQQSGTSNTTSEDITTNLDTSELHVQLSAANKTIANMQEQLHQATERVNELSTKLQKVQSDAENQEQYRADEAEDLRVLHDAQEEEIERLRKALDDVNRELELRDQELEEQKIALSGSPSALEKQQPFVVSESDRTVQEFQQKQDSETLAPIVVDQHKVHIPSENVVAVADLKARLDSSLAAIERLETELDRTRKEHHDRVEHLERVLHEVTEGKEDAEEQLAQLSAVLVVDRSSFTSRSTTRSSALGPGDELDVLVEDRSTAADLSIMLRNVEKLQDNERKAVARARELEYVMAELEELRNTRHNETQELEELVARLKESEAKLASTRDGAMEEYRVEIQKLRSQLKAKDSPRVVKLEEQLREAQVKLSEFENEKAAMAEEYMERIGRLEVERENIEKEFQKLKDEESTLAVKHQTTIQQLVEEKRLVEVEFESSIKSRDGEIAHLKKSMDQICAEKDAILQQFRKAEEDKNAIIRQHKESLEIVQHEKKTTEEKLMSQLQEKESEISDLLVNTSSSSAGEPTSDSDQIAMLKQEIEKLQKQLLEEQVANQQGQPGPYGFIDTGGYQSRGALESELRKQLETLQREREQESRALREKLEDRDTTISALVKSSVVLEQKISDLSRELHHARQGQGSAAHSINVRSDIDDEDVNEEVRALREALADYKEVETRLIHELSQSKKQLKFAESEISRLQEVMDDDGSCDSHHYRRQIQERDDAVSALVQQSMTQESKMQELQKRLQSATQELEAMREEKKRSSVQLKAELRRLHQESEIFAGQIIEQDEELEALRTEIQNRDERIAALNRQLGAAAVTNYRPGMVTPNGESPEVVSLMAKIDELEEANETYRIDLRDARFKLRDFDSTRNELARVKYELDELQRKLDTTAGSHNDRRGGAAALEDAERKIEELLAAKEAACQACDMLTRERDALVAQRDKVIEGLRRNIDGCTSQIEALETEIDTVHAELKEKDQQLDAEKLRVVKLEGQLRSMANENVETRHTALFEEIEDLQQQVKDLESENMKLSAFKHKMDEIEQLQAQTNQMAEAYERKISSLASDKDKTIDSLQKSLMEIKGQAADDFEAMSRDMRKLELENQTLRQEMRIALEQKNSQIFALEHTLDAQEHLVGSMKNEMDHLQGSMHYTVSSRREEIENMEKEVLDLTTRNAAFEREIMSLKMQLEESKLVHMAEVAKLKETVERLEYQAASSPVIRQQKNPIEEFPIDEVKERLQKLRWRNESIQEENFKLKSRLEKAEAEIQSARNEKYRTANLEAKVSTLMKQLEQVEKEHHVAKAAAQNETHPSMGKLTPPQSPQRMSSRPPSRPGSRPESRAGTPLRSTAQHQETQAGSRSGSIQGTPQRKRTPLKQRKQAQAPDTPSRMRGIFSFGKKKDHENMSVVSLPAKPQYLVPPNTSAPQSEKNTKAPISDRSMRSAK